MSPAVEAQSANSWGSPGSYFLFQSWAALCQDSLGFRVPSDSPLGWPCRGGSRSGGQSVPQSTLIACLQIPGQCGPVGEGSFALPLQSPSSSLFLPLVRSLSHPVIFELASSSCVANNRTTAKQSAPIQFRAPPCVWLCPSPARVLGQGPRLSRLLPPWL